MKKALLYIGAGVLALAIVVGTGMATTYLVMTRLVGGTAASADNVPPVTVKDDNKISLKPFTTNLADAGAQRFIMVTFELITKDSTDRDRVNTNLPLVRDAIVAVLTSKKAADLAGEAGGNSLKADILERVNSTLGGNYVLKVLITDQVVQ